MSIRSATIADISTMLEIYDVYVRETAVSFEYVTPTVEEFTHRLEEHMAVYPWLVWEENGQVLGYCYAGRAFERAAYSWNAEISCYLAPAIRRKGIGRQLYAEVERILTAQGVQKVFAVVTSANLPSVRFHEALGYRQCALFKEVGYKLGNWYDVIWLEKRLQTDPTPKAFPKPWTEL